MSRFEHSRQIISSKVFDALGQPFLSRRVPSPSTTVEWLLNAELEHLSRILLVPADSYFSGEKLGRSLPFSNSKAQAYPSKYCHAVNDCPSGNYPLDCTHFMAHILAAGGVVLDGPSHTCAKGLATSAVELHSAFINASEIFDNVHVHKAEGAQSGDIVFLLHNLGANHDHVMLLAGPLDPDKRGAAVYGHTTDRCGEHAGFIPDKCVFYTIEDR